MNRNLIGMGLTFEALPLFFGGIFLGKIKRKRWWNRWQKSPFSVEREILVGRVPPCCFRKRDYYGLLGKKDISDCSGIKEKECNCGEHTILYFFFPCNRESFEMVLVFSEGIPKSPQNYHQETKLVFAELLLIERQRFRKILFDSSSLNLSCCLKVSQRFQDPEDWRQALISQPHADNEKVVVAWCTCGQHLLLEARLVAGQQEARTKFIVQL